MYILHVCGAKRPRRSREGLYLMLGRTVDVGAYYSPLRTVFVEAALHHPCGKLCHCVTSRPAAAQRLAGGCGRLAPGRG